MVDRTNEKNCILRVLGRKKLQSWEIQERSGLSRRIISNCLTMMKAQGILNHNISTGMWWINKVIKS